MSVLNAQFETRSVNGRPVTHMYAKIPAGSFLVYYFLVRDRVRCDRSGQYLNDSNEAGMLFPTPAEAEAFARFVAALSSRIGSGVYNSSWQVVAEFVHDDFVQQQAKANSPGRLFLWAGLLLTAGCVLLWLEVRSRWTLMVGFLIGARLLLSGMLKLVTGISRVMRRSMANTH